MRFIKRGLMTAFFALFGVVLACEPASAQIDLSGEWATRLHEDVRLRNDALGGGPEVGDYTRLPILGDEETD
jgi:hypothetical protein